MTLIIDAAPLVALADTADRMRGPVRGVLAAGDEPLVIPAPVTAEVDQLLASATEPWRADDFSSTSPLDGSP